MREERGNAGALAYPFSLPPDAPAEAIASTVEVHGVAHIEAHLDAETADALAGEAVALLHDDAGWVAHEAYGSGRSVRVLRREIDRVRYPCLHATFDSPFLEDVTAAFYGDGYLFAEQIWVMRDEVDSQTVVQELHYDKLAHLKHFYYLSDVGPGNGPFCCVPGSQSLGRAGQARNRARGVVPTDAEARRLPGDVAERQVAVLGRRGTLIVFDTDIAHRASVATEGPRLAARSLSYGPDSIGRRLYAAG